MCYYTIISGALGEISIIELFILENLILRS